MSRQPWALIWTGAMKLARYRMTAGIEIGVVENDQVFGLRRLIDPAPSSITEALHAGPELWESLTERIKRTPPSTPLADVELLAPVPEPRKVLAVGNNSPSHLAEVQTDTPSPELVTALGSQALIREAFPASRFPTVFNKQTESVSGPFEPIWLPRDALSTVDYEGELAMIVGTRCRRVTEGDAMQHIAGYLVINDVSVREWQIASPLMWQGKSFDTHAPTGPWVTTADEISPENLRLQTWVNGELRQDGTTAEWIHRPAALLAFLSTVCTLVPGDIIAMGTPAGVGIVHGQYLQPGDRVDVEVEGLGRISNPVMEEPLTT